MDNRFVWDPEKEKSNIAKHGISFTEASTVFDDTCAVYSHDTDHTDDEDRFVVLGMSDNEHLLIVCHCYRENDVIIRIFSARKANKSEVKHYFGRL